MALEPDIKACPLAGWTTHTLPGAALLLTVELLESPQAFETGERLTLHIPMNADRADELARALQTAAAAARMGQAPSRTPS